MTLSKDTPLSVEIEDDQLVLRIGIDTLAFCSSRKNGGPLLHWDIDPVSSLNHLV